MSVHSPLHWFPNQEKDGIVTKAALVIVNNHLLGLDTTIKRYWNKFSVKACADGGSNILYDCFTDEIDERDKFIPDVICGDLDSIREEVLHFYKLKGSVIVERPDQDNTDLMKTLCHLQECQKRAEFQFSDVYIMNGLGGRFDQTIANINCLYSSDEQTTYLVSEDSIVFPLKPGSHTIITDSGLEEGHCGLVPLGESCDKCSTIGLKWNLGESQKMKFGGLISTNNLIDSTSVSIYCTTTLLWTMSHKLLDIPL